MLTTTLAGLYERDLRKLIEEIALFRDEANLWKVLGAIHNPAGNLALHLSGGANHFFGAVLLHTGYIRDRDLEFSQKGVPREEMIQRLEAVIPVVTKAINSMTDEQLAAPFPIPFDGANNSTTYVLLRLLSHISYHLGQVNYLRRALEG